ncbi:MAG: hypothetical protein GY835_12935 [bacterium]|nr:hypothetical protein [bacterium]
MTRLLPLALLLLLTSAGHAHELHHEISSPGADETVVIISLFHGDGSPFDYESYSLLPPGEEIPFQSGYTDAHGRVIILPDRDGDWRFRASSEDGHGVNLTIPVQLTTDVAPIGRPLFERFAKPITSLALLFGIFGILALTLRRRQ